MALSLSWPLIQLHGVELASWPFWASVFPPVKWMWIKILFQHSSSTWGSIFATRGHLAMSGSHYPGMLLNSFIALGSPPPTPNERITWSKI